MAIYTAPRCKGEATPIKYRDDEGHIVSESVRCSRRTHDESGYCWLHRDQAATRPGFESSGGEGGGN